MELNWPLNSVVYQIYPRSFKDSNGDGIGDLNGITEKIPYLQDLGITAIWLSPMYPSPQKDLGYDISDYRNVDPSYGSLEDFDTLVKTAHAHNIKVMLDYVPSHTSTQHAWFQESKASIDNPKRDWYTWKDPGPDGGPPNNWRSHFGGSAWELDKTTNQYYLHSFDVDQADLNWRNPDVEKEMLDVLRFWFDRGVDGFRVDAANFLYKDPLFRDEPPNPEFHESHGDYNSVIHTYSRDLPEHIEVMKKVVNVAKEYKEKFIVTEAYVALPFLIKMYIQIGWRWYAPFNFSLITLPWKATTHKEYIDEYDKALGDMYLPCWVLGNHDNSRVATRIGEEQARIAAMLQMTLRGLPFMYNGEEIGMTDMEIPKERVRDTYEINSPGLNLGRDPERTPIQWNTEKNAGFSTADETWLPVNDNYKTINVETESHDPKSMLSLYKTLLDLKKTHAALKDGIYTPLPMPAENVLAYTRETGNDKLLVLLNFDEQEKQIALEMKGKVILDAKLGQTGQEIDLSNFALSANQGYILKI